MGDARHRRTRQALFDALDALLAERPYCEINVTDLSLRAGIGRQTFYRHFESPDGMLKDRLRASLAHQLEQAVQGLAEHAPADWFRYVTRGAFERAAEQPHISRVILRGEAGADALKVFRDQITALWALAPTGNPLTTAPAELRPFIASFHAGAIGAMLLHWIEAGCSPSPETMSDLFASLARRAQLD